MPYSAEQWVVHLQTRNPTADDRRAFERWLRADENNAAAYDRALGTWKSGALLVLSPNAERLRADALHYAGASQSRRHRGWRMALVTSSSVAAIGLGLALVFGADNPQEIHYRTLGAPTDHVTLADGSILDISPETELSVIFRRSAREIRVTQGEVYFDVSHSDTRPFVVLAGNNKIRDVGTRFDVLVDRKEVEVAVAQGSVQVSVSGTPLPVLGVGAGLRVDAANAYTYLPHADPAQIANWRSGWLTYDRKPLNEVLLDINRYSPVKLIIVDKGLADLRLGGRFRVGDVTGVVASLNGIYGIRSKTAGNTIELYAQTEN